MKNKRFESAIRIQKAYSEMRKEMAKSDGIEKRDGEIKISKVGGAVTWNFTTDYRTLVMLVEQEISLIMGDLFQIADEQEGDNEIDQITKALSILCEYSRPDEHEGEWHVIIKDNKVSGLSLMHPVGLLSAIKSIDDNSKNGIIKSIVFPLSIMFLGTKAILEAENQNPKKKPAKKTAKKK